MVVDPLLSNNITAPSAGFNSYVLPPFFICRVFSTWNIIFNIKGPPLANINSANKSLGYKL